MATVSRVLNGKSNTSDAAIEAVEAAIQALNYTPPAPTKRRNRLADSSIGVLVADVSNSFFGLIVKGIDKIAREQGRSLLITNGYHDAECEREAIELLIKHGCGALVIHSKGLGDEVLIKYAQRIPGLILINRYIPAIASHCVSLDNVQGSQMAVQHLINQGHRKIGYLGSDSNIDDAIHRLAGYKQTLVNNNLPCNEDAIVLSEPDEEGGAEAMSNLLAKNMPITALATYNDVMASGAIAVLRQNGIRVPEDISVIGYDDANIAIHIQPKLTTVRYPVQIMAEKAVKLALAFAADENYQPTGTHIYVPTLVPRNSVATITERSD